MGRKTGRAIKAVLSQDARRRGPSKPLRARTSAPAYVSLAFRQAMFDSAMEQFFVPRSAGARLRMQIVREGFAVIPEPILGLQDAHDCYCMRARVPQFLVRPSEGDSYAVILSLFRGTLVRPKAVRTIRGLLRAFPEPEPEGLRAFWRNRSRRIPRDSVRREGVFGSLTRDDYPRRRWLGHPSVPRVVVPALVSVMQRLLRESYEFAIVCAVSDG